MAGLLRRGAARAVGAAQWSGTSGRKSYPMRFSPYPCVTYSSRGAAAVAYAPLRCTTAAYCTARR